MKIVKNIYKEPIVVTYLTDGYPGSVRNRSTAQLLVGDAISVDDNQVSPELLLMHKKGRVEITDVIPEPVKVDHPKSTESDDPSNIEAEERYILELEKELLK